MSVGIVESRDPDKETKKQETAIQRSKLQDLLMRLQSGGGPLPDYLQHLVFTQAIVVAGTEAAAFIIDYKEDGRGELQNVHHIRPDNSSQEVRTQALKAFGELILAALQENRDAAVLVGGAAGDGSEQQYCLITLLKAENRVIAATAVITRCLDNTRAQQRLETMQLVAGYFDMYLLRRGTESVRAMAQNHQDVLQYATSVGTSDNFQSAANNLCNELATRTGASRVSLGWVSNKYIKLKGISHTEEFDKKQELSVQIAKVMEECQDQQEIVQFDPDGDSTQNTVREANTLSRMEGGHRVLSLPLRHKDEIVGVITLEYPADKRPSEAQTTGLAVAAELLAPQLYDRYQNDRWLITKAGISTRETAKMVVGPKHMLAKLLCTLALGLFLFLVFFNPMYRVKAPFAFAPIDRSIVSAPIEAQIAEVYVKPGDMVEAGQPLLQFDVYDLKLNYTNLQKQAEQSRIAARNYLDDRERDRRGEAAQERIKAESFDAQAAIIKRKIDQATITAPVAGQVLDGDWQDQIRNVIKQGDKLFEIAPPGQLRVEVAVSERDIQEIAPGSKGNLRTRSSPDVSYPFTVDRIVPLGDPKEGQNTFKVYGTVAEVQPDWRSGLAGEAAIDVGKKPLLWQWTHRLVDWARLKLWI